MYQNLLGLEKTGQGKEKEIQVLGNKLLELER